MWQAVFNLCFAVENGLDDFRGFKPDLISLFLFLSLSLSVKKKGRYIALAEIRL